MPPIEIPELKDYAPASLENFFGEVMALFDKAIDHQTSKASIFTTFASTHETSWPKSARQAPETRPT